MEYKDYYKILGVSQQADEKEIKRAYRSLALKYHPDKNPGNNQAEDQFKEINEAYEVLGNPENRRKYDQLGSNYHRYQQMGGQTGGFDFSQWFGQQGGGGAQYRTNVNLNDLFGDGRTGSGGFSDFFQTIFGQGGFGSQRASNFGGANFGGANPGAAAQSADAEQTIQLTLEEAYQGTTRTFSRNGERFSAKIPAGAQNGTRVRLRGKGHEGGTGPGDLYLVVELQPHAQFELDDVNLRTEVEVDLLTAVLGGKATVPTLTSPVTLTIPAGAQSGQSFRLKGKGMPHLRQPDQFGDLYAKLKIRIPTQLSAQEKALYEQLASLRSANAP